MKRVLNFKVLGYKLWEILVAILTLSIISLTTTLTGSNALFEIVVPALVLITITKYMINVIWDILDLKRKL